MPKRKDFLHPKNKNENKNKNGTKARDEAPESENDYLAAGVDCEEAGEKWRAGDAAKSLRFFIRATETYDAGLQRFPTSFDLAYNKARIQYEVTQQPRLLVHLPTALTDLLRVALDSHRIALKIEQDSPDLLFNTAQVLTSLAEAITEGRNPPKDEQDHALRLLQEALELFQRCLNLQEYKYEQARKEAAEAADDPPTDANGEPSNISCTGSNVSEEEVWASVEEPITKDALLDTAIAQLETLTTLCNLNPIQGHSGLVWIEEFYRSTLQGKVSYYLGTTRQHEATLAKAKFVAAISDAGFQIGRLDLLTYEREMTAAFTDPELTMASDPQGLCDRADAELSFNTSVQASIPKAQLEEIPQVASLCWKHITKALESLTAASKIPNASNLPRIHLRRGDCEMLRLRLGDAPLRYDLVIKSLPTLLRNAEIYYHGAGALGKGSKDDEVVQKEADIKEALAAALAGDTQRLLKLIELQRDSVETVTEEMRDEGLLGEEVLQKIQKLFV